VPPAEPPRRASLPRSTEALRVRAGLVLGGTAANAAEATGLGRTGGIAALALALGAALVRGPLPRRASIWCAALVAFALPWEVLVDLASGPSPGSGLGALIAVAALAAEASLALRRQGLPEWVTAALEAALLALVVIGGHLAWSGLPA
jgi:hypothetical protein